MHRMKYLNQSLANASDLTIKELLIEGGFGGVIALDNNGNGALGLSTMLKRQSVHFLV